MCGVRGCEGADAASGRTQRRSAGCRFAPRTTHLKPRTCAPSHYTHRARAHLRTEVRGAQCVPQLPVIRATMVRAKSLSHSAMFLRAEAVTSVVPLLCAFTCT